MANPKWFKWTVEFSVGNNIVADGFDLTEERAKRMIENDLVLSYGYETKARVISVPDPEAIRKAQGYKD